MLLFLHLKIMVMDYYQLAFTLNSNKLNGIKLKTLTDILVESKLTNDLLSKLISSQNSTDISNNLKEQEMLRKKYRRDILTELYSDEEELPDEVKELIKNEG
jgi:hypothetical protein